MTAKRSRRDLAKQETREALIDAGILEMAEKGLDSPSLDAICARAGYTRGAFYVHFKDREDFLEAVVQRALNSFLDAVIATGEEGADLQRTIARFLSSLAAQHLPSPSGATLPLHQVMDAVSRVPGVERRLGRVFQDAVERVSAVAQRGQGAGSVRRDIDASQIGLLYVAAALGLVTLAQAGVSADLDSATEAATRMVTPPQAE